MDVNRRHLIGTSAAGFAGALAISPDAARAAPLTSALGRDATQYGVRPGSPDDQTRILQRAIDDAARAQVPLALPPGAYRTSMLRLQNGTQLVGVRGATRLMFTGGASMHRAAEHRHANIHCFPSSIDTAHFTVARTKEGADPEDQAAIARPRLGFFGVIDERFDIDLLGRVAALRPDWQFVMIGPVVKIDPATLPQAANIHWLGGKQYADLPGYLAHWDIGFMPFAINESTKYISPTKTPEFLAAGLPVVSTAITDVVTPYGDKRLVEIASTAEETVAAVERCFARERGPWLEAVDAQLSGGSWDSTWDAMRALMLKKLSSPAAADSGAASFNQAKEIAHV